MAFLDDASWQGKVYSGGWKRAGGGEAPVLEPATGSQLGSTGIAYPADVAMATTTAAAAQQAWAALPHTERSAMLRRAATEPVALGPIIDERQRDKIHGLVTASVDAGARLAGARFGGTANLDAFTDTRWVTLRGEIASYPF